MQTPAMSEYDRFFERATRRGSRSGRVARQFAIDWTGRDD
jgi:predicted AAA+ superfamily ATPase